MYEFKQLTREDIISKFQYKPVYIENECEKMWYICVKVNAKMPVHMLSIKESELHEKNENYVDGINIVGEDCEDGYCLWIDFNKLWKAYGFVEV